MKNIRSKENRIHSSAEKPFSFYECIIPDLFPYVPMHWHDEFEVNYIIDGSAEFICGDEKFISQKGDIIITQPNVIHSIYTSSRQVYDTLVFSSSIFGESETDRYIKKCILPLIDGTMRLKSHINPEHCYYSEIRIIAENIFSCARGNLPHLDMLMRGELLRLFWLLETDSEEGNPNDEISETMRPALLYIKEHFKDTISVQQLADSVHLSQSYFMSQFRQCVGFSASEYISQYRINYACKQIADTTSSISEIAFESGFRNLSNFNRHFMRIVGCTPMAYRKKSRTQRIQIAEYSLPESKNI